MKIIKDFEQGSEEWFDFRKGKISGSRLHDVYQAKAATKAEMMEALQKKGIDFDPKSKVEDIKALLPLEVKAEFMANAEKKLEFYQLVADRLAEDPDDEERRARGLRLEDEAIKRFEKEFKVDVERVGVCVSDKDPRIINSPDGLIKKRGKYSEAVEVKCLSSARHIQAYVEKKIPDEFYSQTLQYFIVNEELNHLNYVFYDDRVPSLDFFCLYVSRGEVVKDLDLFEKYQIMLLDEADKIVESLSF